MEILDILKLPVRREYGLVPYFKGCNSPTKVLLCNKIQKHTVGTIKHNFFAMRYMHYINLSTPNVELIRPFKNQLFCVMRPNIFLRI